MSKQISIAMIWFHTHVLSKHFKLSASSKISIFFSSSKRKDQKLFNTKIILHFNGVPDPEKKKMQNQNAKIVRFFNFQTNFLGSFSARKNV